MSANLGRGASRQIDYCGITYHVTPVARPAGFSGRGKEDWRVDVAAASSVDAGRVLSTFCPTLGRARKIIHDHAVAVGAYAKAWDEAGRMPRPRETVLDRA